MLSTIALGSVVYAIGFQYFMFPNDIVSGGVTGIAMILNHFTRWPVGMTVLVLNIPLFVIAWRHFGADYLVGSLVGTAVSSVCVDIFASTGGIDIFTPATSRKKRRRNKCNTSFFLSEFGRAGPRGGRTTE